MDRTTSRYRQIHISSQILTPVSILDRTNRQKISKDIEDLKNTIDQLELLNITGHRMHTPF